MDLIVNFTNTPQYFNETMPIDLNLKLNNTYMITLPPFKDNETNPIFLTYSSPPPLNISEIITFLPPDKFNITAWKWDHLGLYPVTINLSDSVASTAYTFLMKIYNDPPDF